MKKILIINPPDLNKYFYEQNIYSKDGLYVINTILKNYYPEIERETIDFDFLNLGIFDVFDKVKESKPDFVYLNLNSYNCVANSHLCLGIKKHCPDTKIIVGFNLSDKIKKDLDSKVFKSIDYFLDYDLNSLKIDKDLLFQTKVFEKKKDYKTIYFQNKTNDEIIDEINLSLDNCIDRFIFRECKNYSYDDLKNILNKTKKHFKFILENDILDVCQINSLKKEFKMIGIILDLNNGIFFAQKAKQINVFSFCRFELREDNKKIYECLKKYNLLFLDIVSNDLIPGADFKNFRNKELYLMYKEKDYLLDNIKYWIFNPIKFLRFCKYKDYLWSEIRYLR